MLDGWCEWIISNTSSTCHPNHQPENHHQPPSFLHSPHRCSSPWWTVRDAAVLRQQRRSTEGCRHRANRGKGGRTWEDRWEKPWFFQWEKLFISFKSLLTGLLLTGPLLKVAILSKKTSKTHTWWFTIKKKTTETTNQITIGYIPRKIIMG